MALKEAGAPQETHINQSTSYALKKKSLKVDWEIYFKNFDRGSNSSFHSAQTETFFLFRQTRAKDLWSTDGTRRSHCIKASLLISNKSVY